MLGRSRLERSSTSKVEARFGEIEVTFIQSVCLHGSNGISFLSSLKHTGRAIDIDSYYYSVINHQGRECECGESKR